MLATEEKKNTIHSRPLTTSIPIIQFVSTTEGKNPYEHCLTADLKGTTLFTNHAKIRPFLTTFSLFTEFYIAFLSFDYL